MKNSFVTFLSRFGLCGKLRISELNGIPLERYAQNGSTESLNDFIKVNFWLKIAPFGE